MSYTDGMAALNLEVPDRVPRTEYSAESHWPLIKRVTGIDVDAHSPDTAKAEASKAFMRAWNYDFRWSVLTTNAEFGEKRSYMGHAVYADGGVDYNTQTFELFDDPEDVFSCDPFELYGARDLASIRADYEASYAAGRDFFPDAVNMTGIYITCMSGLIDMLGWDLLLCAAGTDQKRFGEFTNRYCAWIGRYFEALAASDVPVVMIHDDIVWTEGVFIHPDWYRKYVFPNYKRCFGSIIESGKKLMFTSDGTFTEFIDDIASCGVSGFVMEPTTDMAYIAEKYGRTHSFIGNADTRVLLYGSREDIEGEVRRCMDIGRGCPGFFMAVGNHIPANTPVDSCLWYNDIYEKLSRR